jgi:hypothetical protein
VNRPSMGLPRPSNFGRTRLGTTPGMIPLVPYYLVAAVGRRQKTNVGRPPSDLEGKIITAVEYLKTSKWHWEGVLRSR